MLPINKMSNHKKNHMIMENEKEKLKKRLLFSDGDLHVYAGITKKEFPELYDEIRTIIEEWGMHAQQPLFLFIIDISLNISYL